MADASSESESAYSVISGGLDSPSSYESNDSAYSRSEGSASDSGPSTSNGGREIQQIAGALERSCEQLHQAGRFDHPADAGVVPLLSSLESCMGESSGGLDLLPWMLDTVYEPDELVRTFHLLCSNGDPVFPGGNIDTSTLDLAAGEPKHDGKGTGPLPVAEDDTRGEMDKPAKVTAGGSICTQKRLPPQPAPETEEEDDSSLELHLREDERDLTTPKPETPQIIIVEESDEEEPGENHEEANNKPQPTERAHPDSGSAPDVRRIRKVKVMSEPERDRSRARQRKRRREIEESRPRGDSSGSGSREDHEYSRPTKPALSRPVMQAANSRGRRERRSSPCEAARDRFRKNRLEAERLRAQEEDLRSSINHHKRKLEELRGEDRPKASAPRKSQSDGDLRDPNSSERYVRYKSS